eukprot:gb/GFBE01040900.1/.p1 GENE.gb/GFBE01040900.1/~~gb/GFBE01040900.1/.p1  ORF type:complete len:248 (+),score=73.33 gb/GFBE01040900.1/:1-744(+)
MIFIRPLCLALAAMQVGGAAVEFSGHPTVHRARPKKDFLHRLTDQQRAALHSRRTSNGESSDQKVKGGMDKLKHVETDYKKQMEQRKASTAKMMAQIAKMKASKGSEKGSTDPLSMMNLTEEDKAFLLSKTQSQLRMLGLDRNAPHHSTGSFRPGKGSAAASKSSKSEKPGSFARAMSATFPGHQSQDQKHHAMTAEQVNRQKQLRGKVKQHQVLKQKQLQTKHVLAESSMKQTLMQVAPQTAITFG